MSIFVCNCKVPPPVIISPIPLQYQMMNYEKIFISGKYCNCYTEIFSFDVWLTVHCSSMWIKRPTRCHFWYDVYFSFIGCSTCFGPPCAHLQEPTTCRYLSDVLQSRGCVGSQIRLVACLSIGKHLAQLC